ncbi:MAG TPA: hypothetical protein VII94_01025 [Candidatus Saccharimonadales bacterium]
MDTLHRNISGFFDELLVDLKCQPDTRSYIIGIYGKYNTAEFDFSQDSVTLLFSQARDKQDFLTYQNLGDWIFFANTVAPQHLKNASKDYYDTVARLSYYSCYRLIKCQWKLFEELADDFLNLEEQVKRRLPKLNNQISVGTYIDPFGF